MSTPAPLTVDAILAEAFEAIPDEFPDADLADIDLDESLTKAQRDKIDDDDFAWPEKRKYPIDTQAHLDAAATLIGRAPQSVQAKIKRNAIRIAKRKGFTLPKSWQDELNDNGGEKAEDATQQEALPDATAESAPGTPAPLVSASVSPAAASTAPRASIATVTICFIEDGARSLNGRIYPPETVDLLLARAQERLLDPNGLPVTSYVNHASADSDQTLQLVGMALRVWKEGTKGYAELAMADTTAGRDTVALIRGGFLRTESLRASGVTTRLDKRYDLPVVVEADGARAELDGIDFTSYPGLQSVARIQHLLLESQIAGEHSLCEAFALDAHLNILQEGTAPMPTTEKKRAPMPHEEAQKMAHDHLANVLDECLGCAAHKGAKESTLTEAGRKLAAKNAAHLIEAHRVLANQCGMECANCYDGIAADLPAQIPEDGDGDDDLDGIPDATDPADESAHHEGDHAMPMTKEEALKLLAAEGFEVELKPKKTEAQLLQERLEAQDRQIAEQNARIDKLLALAEGKASAAPSMSPTRQTLVEGANTPEQPARELPPQIYTNGSYLRDKLHPKNWKSFLDRTRPLPEGIDPTLGLKEMGVFLSARITEMVNEGYSSYNV